MRCYKKVLVFPSEQNNKNRTSAALKTTKSKNTAGRNIGSSRKGKEKAVSKLVYESV